MTVEKPTMGQGRGGGKNTEKTKKGGKTRKGAKGRAWW